jgi:hypothetical protein
MANVNEYLTQGGGNQELNTFLQEERPMKGSKLARHSGISRHIFSMENSGFYAM